MSKRTCELKSCSKPFAPARAWQKYCSKACKQAAERAKQKEQQIAAASVVKGKNAAAVALGRLGGLATQQKRTAEQRREFARKGGLARAAQAKQQRRTHENNS